MGHACTRAVSCASDNPALLPQFTAPWNFRQTNGPPGSKPPPGPCTGPAGPRTGWRLGARPQRWPKPRGLSDQPFGTWKYKFVDSSPFGTFKQTPGKAQMVMRLNLRNCAKLKPKQVVAQSRTHNLKPRPCLKKELSLTWGNAHPFHAVLVGLGKQIQSHQEHK